MPCLTLKLSYIISAQHLRWALKLIHLAAQRVTCPAEAISQVLDYKMPTPTWKFANLIQTLALTKARYQLLNSSSTLIRANKQFIATS